MSIYTDKPGKEDGPRIPRVGKPDEANSLKAGHRPKDPWTPGLVEVQFREAKDSGLLDHDFSKGLDTKKRSKNWSPAFSKVVSENRLIAWRPTFPLKYSWSKETDDEARKFFSASGRDRLITLRFPDDADVSKIAKQLQALPFVTRANPVAKIKPAQPDDPLFGTDDQIVTTFSGLENQWYAFRCKLPEALESATGQGVTIAAIDWGFDVFHEDYGTAIALTKNIFNDDDDVTVGSQFHGTAAMGLAGARDNDRGMVGFAPDSTLWAIQAGRNNIEDHFDWSAAIDFVRMQTTTQRKVIYLEIQTASEGNIECIGAINNAIVMAIAANIVVCVPAGNSPGDANLDDNGFEIPETGSVLVGATLYDPDPLQNFVFGKEGERIVVYAPGDMMHDVTCSPVDTYTPFFGGTSGAVAKVAGAVALMLEADDSLTPAEIRSILSSSSIPVINDSSEEVGKLLDCAHAMSEVQARSEMDYACRSSEPIHAY